MTTNDTVVMPSAQGRPALETRTLRNAFGSFATGVTIVTAKGADETDVGLTANSFSSVSLTPPMVLWSLAETSSSIDAFRDSAHFAVHILSSGQEALSVRFATKGGDKFAGTAIDRGPGGIPMLRDCMARFICQKAYQYEGGDHVIFVGEILDYTHAEGPPLVFHGGRYGMLLRNEPEPPNPSEQTESGLSSDDLLYHLSNVYFMIRRAAIDERHRRGWKDEDYAILSILGRKNDLLLAEIVAYGVAHGRTITLPAFERLIALGLIDTALPLDGSNKVRLLTAGRAALVEIVAILKASEADALKAFDPSEIQLLKRLLRRVSAGRTSSDGSTRQTLPQARQS